MSVLPFNPVSSLIVISDPYALEFTPTSFLGSEVEVSFTQLSHAVATYLSPGTLFNVTTDTGITKGVLTSLDLAASTFQLLLAIPLSQLPSSIQLSKWGELTRITTQWVRTNGVLEARAGLSALLLANCSYSSGHSAGLIGWSLYKTINGKHELVVRGNDREQIGVISTIKEGYLWTAGEYTLKAIRYSSVGMFPIQRAERKWVNNTSFPTLAVGTLEDHYNPLAL